MISKRPPLKASFLAPGARKPRVSSTSACPDCKSTDVVFMLHPNTCELVQMLDHTLMKCGTCGSEFAADYVAALTAIAIGNPSGNIAEDLICPECRNSIQGQRTGRPCASCGNVILEHMAMSRRMSRGINPWRIIIPAMVMMTAIGVTYAFAPPPWGKVSIVGSLALVELWQGVYGLATRRFEYRDGMATRVHSGIKAIGISMLHVVIGTALGGVALAIWAGRLEWL